jgi:WD40 repeat protein
LAFSPDGATLAVAGWDNTIRPVDVETGQPLGVPLSLHTDRIAGLAFSPKGEYLASSSWDARIYIWTMDPDAWRARACMYAGRNLTRQEWATYLPDFPYRKTCDEWPEGE